jgi:N utilization substance protein B
MSTEPGSTRARGRELALLAACHLESYPASEREAALELLWKNPPGAPDQAVFLLAAEPSARGFADHLLALLAGHAMEVDPAIERASTRWRLDRMDRVERNVLRLAAVELAYDPDTPRGVVLAEAVRLAERYGGERSARFVNGVVESLAAMLREGP